MEDEEEEGKKKKGIRNETEKLNTKNIKNLYEEIQIE